MQRNVIISILRLQETEEKHNKINLSSRSCTECIVTLAITKAGHHLFPYFQPFLSFVFYFFSFHHFALVLSSLSASLMPESVFVFQIRESGSDPQPLLSFAHMAIHLHTANPVSLLHANSQEFHIANSQLFQRPWTGSNSHLPCFFFSGGPLQWWHLTLCYRHKYFAL